MLDLEKVITNDIHHHCFVLKFGKLLLVVITEVTQHHRPMIARASRWQPPNGTPMTRSNNTARITNT
jgi:hypothetical protein